VAAHEIGQPLVVAEDLVVARVLHDDLGAGEAHVVDFDLEPVEHVFERLGVGLEIDRLLDVGLGQVPLVLLLAHARPGEVRRHERGVELDRLVVAHKRALAVAVPHMDVALFHVQVGGLGVDLERLADGVLGHLELQDGLAVLRDAVEGVGELLARLDR
jgi:hypothetical protein